MAARSPPKVAAVDILAIVGYNQPILRSRSTVRGAERVHLSQPRCDLCGSTAQEVQADLCDDCPASIARAGTCTLPRSQEIEREL
jgi:hypothetical protein